MDETYKALMRKAGAILARRSYSRGELRDRLVKVSDESYVEPVLDRLEQLKLLNDADYAYNFALCRMKQDGWGPAKVQTSLLRRHVGQGIIEGALQRVQSELGREAAIASYVQGYCSRRGLPADLKSLRKLIRHLTQRGFDEDGILHVLKRMIPGKLWQRFETGECSE